MIPLGSAITKKILNYFFINPHESLYVNELSRRLEVDKRNLVKKIKELESEGLLKSQSKGNLKLYSINTSYSLYTEYRKIIMATVGFQEQLSGCLKNIAGIREAYIYGSYAKNTMDGHSDIDVLVVGDAGTVAVQKSIGKLQKDIDREISVTVMSKADFKRRVKEKDPFVAGILKQKHIKII
ncbi:MAG: nucleotidyltransferase domain-containing protein [Candidatus Omnitrophica bacterium]|nr:nucleotidyltransferase domain-containing protein [Candidatus Omnitrophota bacterium]